MNQLRCQREEELAILKWRAVANGDRSLDLLVTSFAQVSKACSNLNMEDYLKYIYSNIFKIHIFLGIS